MLLNFLWVAIGGAVGASLRYAVYLFFLEQAGNSFPWGTLIANLVGCLMMGILIGLGLQKEMGQHYLLFGVGVLGALTTFSSFSGETLQLAMDQRWWATALNILVNVAGCLLGCWMGLAGVKWCCGS